MNYLKMLALAAVAASALMVFIGAGTASGSAICSTTVSPCPSTQRWPEDIKGMDLSLTGGTLQTIDAATGEQIDTCTGSTVKGTFTNGTTPTNPGSSMLHVEELTFTGCSFPTKAIQLGTFGINKIAGTSNGTVVGASFKVTINTVFFGSCVYGTGESLSIGDLTEGNPPVFHAQTHVFFISGGAFCPTTVEWRATYSVTTAFNTTGSLSSS